MRYFDDSFHCLAFFHGKVILFIFLFFCSAHHLEQFQLHRLFYKQRLRILRQNPQKATKQLLFTVTADIFSFQQHFAAEWLSKPADD